MKSAHFEKRRCPSHAWFVATSYPKGPFAILAIATLLGAATKSDAQVFTNRAAYLSAAGPVYSEPFEGTFASSTLLLFPQISVSSNILLRPTSRADLVSEGVRSVYVEHVQSTQVTWNFAVATRAFGIDINDFGDATSPLTITAVIPSAGINHVVLTTPPLLAEGERRFWGYIASSPFQSVTFRIQGQAATTEAIAFDDAAFSCLSVSSPGTLIQCPHSDTTIALTVVGTGPFTYQWRKDTTPIDPLANPSAATATLTLSNVGPDDVASYDCIVTNACGSVTSNAATLTICRCLTCAADFNEDGGVDGEDVGTFFAAWESGICDADVNQDGGVDGDDVSVFFSQWEAGGC